MRVSTSPSDAELIARARTGDGRAHHDLRDRHLGAARRLARRLGQLGPRADELVDEAFALMRADLEQGAGPDISFRSELFATVSRVVARSADRTDAPAIVVNEQPEGSALARAYESLPEHWRAVLWYADIERATPADIDAHLGVTAAEFAALAYRARTQLRQTYLTLELDAEIPDSCRLAQDRLEGYELDALSSGENVRVARHLAACTRCRELAAELTDLRGALARAVAPLVLGPASAAYLADAADEPVHTANGRSRRQPQRSRGRTSIAMVAVSVLLAGLVTWIVYGASAASVSDVEVALDAAERGELGPSGALTSASDAVASDPADPAVVGQDEPLPDGSPTPPADGDDQDGDTGEVPAGAGSPPAAPGGAAPTNPPAPAASPPPPPSLPSPPAATTPATPPPPASPPAAIESTPVAPTPMADLSIEVSGAHHGSQSVAVVVTNHGPHAAASPTVEIKVNRLPRSVPPGCEIHHSRYAVSCSLGVMGPGDQIGGSIGVVDGSDVRKLRVTSSTLDPVPANNEWSR